MATTDTIFTALKTELEVVIDTWEGNETWDGRENKDENDDEDSVMDDEDEDEDEDDEDDEDELDEREIETRREKREPAIKQALLDVQSKLIELVRKVESESPGDLPRVVEVVDLMLNRASLWANDNEGNGWRPYKGSHMPSYAHNPVSSPLLQDTRSSTDGKITNREMLAKLLPLFRQMHAEFPEATRNPDELLLKFPGPRPWRDTIRLHPSSTLCSRFKEPVPEWTQNDRNDQATAVFQARCEVTSGTINQASLLNLSANGELLTFACSGGWKNRIPFLSYFLPAEGRPDGDDFLQSYTTKLDLWDHTRSSWIDDQRRLVFVGDWDRVKSYRYRPAHAAEGAKIKFPVHTMNSKNYSGPLALLGDEELIRAGKGSVAIWQLDGLQTHGENGKDLVGEKVREGDMSTWRDDPEDIEPSSGSAISKTIQLEGYNSYEKQQEGPEIRVWHRHPSQGGVMICGMDDKSSNNFCHAYDLQAGGRIVSRYLGHGGAVEEFSTVPSADPNLFLTRCTDGHARLYDVRHPLPVATIVGARDQLELMTGAALAMPNGHPFAFTSSASSEDIKLWDLRARAVVYELATGNNTVESLAWDQFTNSLYAATSCLHRSTGYRRARYPKQRPEGEDDLNNDAEDEEEEHPHRRWPTGAFHSENYWGHIFDCGKEHRMFQYTFKCEPDTSVLPFYG
ncbi:hypothetical protein CPB83DRAFT_819534 [Crepidotus variabilis]|uniref:Uncharacterized protein n=1 Tax=Crepidotus variabilis TaxID=179855 RepID=A0A9P6E996_9AGAR|nr:hypothetical protein CPB83DRAFT_819534 [Crepidotus variabilis]